MYQCTREGACGIHRSYTVVYIVAEFGLGQEKSLHEKNSVAHYKRLHHIALSASAFKALNLQNLSARKSSVQNL